MAPNSKLKPLLDNASYVAEVEKSNNKAIIFSVVITAIIFSALTFFWQNFSQKDKNVEISQLSSQVAVLSNQVAVLQKDLPKIVNTENNDSDDPEMKTYTNSVYGYSFQYPKNWQAAASKNNKADTFLGVKATESGNATTGINVVSFDGSLEEYLVWLQENTQLTINSQTTIKVDNLKAIKVFYSWPTGERIMVALKDNKNIISITLHSDSEEDLKIFNQIIDSFKLN